MVTGTYNAVSQVERRHSDAGPGLGGRVCVVVGDEDGNWSFFLLFKKIKDSHTFLKYIGLLETLKIPNYLRTSFF